MSWPNVVYFGELLVFLGFMAWCVARYGNRGDDE